MSMDTAMAREAVIDLCSTSSDDDSVIEIGKLIDSYRFIYSRLLLDYEEFGDNKKRRRVTGGSYRNTTSNGEAQSRFFAPRR